MEGRRFSFRLIVNPYGERRIAANERVCECGNIHHFAASFCDACDQALIEKTKISWVGFQKLQKYLKRLEATKPTKPEEESILF